MPAGGSKPGERRGGRQKGTPNRRKIEQAILKEAIVQKIRSDPRRLEALRYIEKQAEMAAKAVSEMREAGGPLAKDALDMFLRLFMNQAGRYQPRHDNPQADEDKFERWAKNAVEVAKALAPFQSPTYRAIMMAPPPPEQHGPRKKRFTLTIVDNHNGRLLPAEASVDDLDDDAA